MATIGDHLQAARSRLDRVSKDDLDAAVAAGAVLVDIRPVEQRDRDGVLEGALVIDRNVLEWRFAPTSGSRLDDVDPNSQVIVVCNQGYQSSLAAASLQDVGVPNATDLIGGYQSLIGGPYDPNG